MRRAPQVGRIRGIILRALSHALCWGMVGAGGRLRPGPPAPVEHGIRRTAFLNESILLFVRGCSILRPTLDSYIQYSAHGVRLSRVRCLAAYRSPSRLLLLAPPAPLAAARASAALRRRAPWISSYVRNARQKAGLASIQQGPEVRRGASAGTARYVQAEIRLPRSDPVPERNPRPAGVLTSL